MRSAIVERAPLLMAGFDFFGDPFRSHAGWSEENEIGRLWQRWMSYLQDDPHPLNHLLVEPEVMYEVHVYHPETLRTGEFEIFVGMAIERVEILPPRVVVKTLDARRYALFTLCGQEIVSDWMWQLDSEWLPALGVQRTPDFSFQRYDSRFKGLNGPALEASELDVYIPLLPTS